MDTASAQLVAASSLIDLCYRLILDGSAGCERVSDGRIVGMLQVRLALNDYLLHYGGHIGYSVRPDERQQGIATWMLHNVLTYCREIGLKRVMVDCEPWNVGSRKTILRNGGVYEKTVHEDGENIDLEHYWISLT